MSHFPFKYRYYRNLTCNFLFSNILASLLIICEAESLFSHLSDLCSESIPVVILNVFNLPDINCNTLFGCPSLAHTFCDLVFKLNLLLQLELIESPTHIHGNTLDLLLTNSYMT